MMGTRADFYVGRGKESEWVGSIAWDGYWDGIDKSILMAKTKRQFLKALEKFFSTRTDITLPAQGWPWPWDTSDITDCSYAFDKGKVWQESQKHWVTARREPSEKVPRGSILCEWPNMKERKNVTFGPRSGLIVIGIK